MTCLMDLVDVFDAAHLESLAKVLADTSEGLTGTEIGRLLAACQMSDPTPTITKWKRLYNAFVEAQNQHECGNHVLMIVNRAMAPVRYTSDPEAFARRRQALNAILAFSGMHIGEDGQTRRSQKAHNLRDALERADRLQAALSLRCVHPDVLRYCSAELLQQNYFHAVLEACKSIAAKIRTLSGLASDGAELAQAAFGVPKDGTPPKLAINPLSNETERGEQRGFANLLVGLFGTIRNPTAHSPKIEWPMDEQDALDILTLTSLVHRKLDRAKTP